MRRNYCQACSFAKAGVKTRIALPCTCGRYLPRQKVRQEYIPTREELDKYLARLKELMEEDEKGPNLPDPASNDIKDQPGEPG